MEINIDSFLEEWEKIKSKLKDISKIKKIQGNGEDFDKIGIAKVKPVVNKETGEITYQPTTRWYVKHLDKSISTAQLFNRKVFTQYVLGKMEPIIYDYFKYPSYEECMRELEEIDERLNEIEDKDMLTSDEFDIESDDNLFN